MGQHDNTKINNQLFRSLSESFIMIYTTWLMHLKFNGGCTYHVTNANKDQRAAGSFQCALTFRIKCSRMSLNKYAFYTPRKLLETAWSACFEVKNHENKFANEFWLTTNKTPAVESINTVSLFPPIASWPRDSRYKPQLRIKSHKRLANQIEEAAE